MIGDDSSTKTRRTVGDSSKLTIEEFVDPGWPIPPDKALVNNTRSLLSRYHKDRFCPGPQPLTETTSKFLIGRTREIDYLTSALTRHRLVTVTGDSGVGKSSLIRAGLVPKLKARGSAIVVLDRWDAVQERPLIETITDTVQKELQLTHDSFSGVPRNLQVKSSPFGILSELGSRLVVIIDQFEELIRTDSDSTEKFSQFAAVWRRYLSAPLLLSLRREHLLELHEIETNFAPAERTRVIIRSLPDTGGIELIDTAIAGTNREKSGRFIGLLKSCWKDEHSHSNHPPNLTHLHSALRLHERILTSTRKPDDSAYEIHRLETLESSLGQKGPDAWNRVLASDLSIAIDEAVEALSQTPQPHIDETRFIDRVTLRSIHRIAARIVPHLSSDGFKLHREVGELAESVMLPELTRYKDAGNKFVTGMFAEMVSSAVNGNSSVPSKQYSILPDGIAGRFTGTGFGAGMSSARRILLEANRTAWAFLVLEIAGIVRLTSINGTIIVSLIHDDYGESLSKWSTEYINADKKWVFDSLSAGSGVSHIWSTLDWNPIRDKRLIVNPHSLKWRIPTIIHSLNFRGSRLSDSHVSNAIIVNADFRGALFANCSFEDVTFVNCNFDGTEFFRCQSSGTDPVNTLNALNSVDFQVGVDQPWTINESTATAILLDRYHETNSNSVPLLISAPTGSPCRAGDSEDTRFLPNFDGGLNVVGGSMRGTLFDGCLFERVNILGSRSSGLSIRGGKLDARFRLSAICRFDVSPGRSISSGSSHQVEVDLDFIECIGMQWWFDSSTAGSAHLSNSWVDDVITHRDLSFASDASTIEFQASRGNRFKLIELIESTLNGM